MKHPLSLASTLSTAVDGPLYLAGAPEPAPRVRRRKQSSKEGDYPPGMRPAGILIRFGARFIDGALFWALGILLSLLAGFAGLQLQESESMLIPLVQLALGGIYETWLTSSSWQGTLGKVALDIKVVRSGGERLSVGRSLARWAAYLLVFGLIWTATFFLGVLLTPVILVVLPPLILWPLASHPRKRLPHDLIAGTAVVHLGKGRSRRPSRRRKVKSTDPAGAPGQSS
jgi:uncharacterized RDD family membrane protein YckC